mmetsp:Transcript_103850/g.289304  ORF Transcript_103850/g.289304 Transcript_103850/m.289304 type:complete len:545 (+) Transcript_103850:39-1673(+)
MDREQKVAIFRESLGGGVDVDSAQSILAAYDWDLQAALNTVLGDGGDAVPRPQPTEALDAEGYRSPLRTGYTDTLMAPITPAEERRLQLEREAEEQRREQERLAQAEAQRLAAEHARHEAQARQVEQQRLEAERLAWERRRQRQAAQAAAAAEAEGAAAAVPPRAEPPIEQRAPAAAPSGAVAAAGVQSALAAPQKRLHGAEHHPDTGEAARQPQEPPQQQPFLQRMNLPVPPTGLAGPMPVQRDVPASLLAQQGLAPQRTPPMPQRTVPPQVQALAPHRTPPPPWPPPPVQALVPRRMPPPPQVEAVGPSFGAPYRTPPPPQVEAVGPGYGSAGAQGPPAREYQHVAHGGQQPYPMARTMAPGPSPGGGGIGDPGEGYPPLLDMLQVALVGGQGGGGGCGGAAGMGQGPMRAAWRQDGMAPGGVDGPPVAPPTGMDAIRREDQDLVRSLEEQQWRQERQQRWPPTQVSQGEWEERQQKRQQLEELHLELQSWQQHEQHLREEMRAQREAPPMPTRLMQRGEHRSLPMGAPAQAGPPRRVVQYQ